MTTTTKINNICTKINITTTEKETPGPSGPYNGPVAPGPLGPVGLLVLRTSRCYCSYAAVVCILLLVVKLLRLVVTLLQVVLTQLVVLVGGVLVVQLPVVQLVVVQ